MRTLPEVLNGALRTNEAVLLCPDCAKQQTFETTPRGNVGGDSKDTGSALQGGDIGSTKGGGVMWNSVKVIDEADPTGRKPNEPGAKLDAGKSRLGLVINGFARALQEVGKVGTYGANKYTDNGWMDVPNGTARYTDALYRHLLKEASGELVDGDTQLLHAAHSAWNALSRLDLILRERESKLNKGG